MSNPMANTVSKMRRLRRQRRALRQLAYADRPAPQPPTWWLLHDERAQWGEKVMALTKKLAQLRLRSAVVIANTDAARREARTSVRRGP